MKPITSYAVTEAVRLLGVIDQEFPVDELGNVITAYAQAVLQAVETIDALAPGEATVMAAFPGAQPVQAPPVGQPAQVMAQPQNVNPFPQAAPQFAQPPQAPQMMPVPQGPAPVPGASGLHPGSTKDEQWMDLITNPANWVDQRTTKGSPNAPDFVHQWIVDPKDARRKLGLYTHYQGQLKVPAFAQAALGIFQ